MTEQLKPTKTGLALGLTFAIVSLICAILVYLFPQGMISLANSIFHGVEFSASTSLTFTKTVLGVVATFVIGFVGGWIFAAISNRLHN